MSKRKSRTSLFNVFCFIESLVNDIKQLFISLFGCHLVFGKKIFSFHLLKSNQFSSYAVWLEQRRNIVLVYMFMLFLFKTVNIPFEEFHFGNCWSLVVPLTNLVWGQNFRYKGLRPYAYRHSPLHYDIFKIAITSLWCNRLVQYLYFLFL